MINCSVIAGIINRCAWKFSYLIGTKSTYMLNENINFLRFNEFIEIFYSSSFCDVALFVLNALFLLFKKCVLLFVGKFCDVTLF